MGYDVLVQSQTEGEYRAIVLGWPDLVATGKSERVAVDRVTKALREQLAHSKVIHIPSEIAEIGSPEAVHPWQEFLGMWAEDETFDDFVQLMAEQRAAENKE